MPQINDTLAVLVTIAERGSDVPECERSLDELERLLDTAGGVCVAKVIQVKESFDPRTVAWLKKNRPQIIRGQLAYNYFSKKGFLPWPIKVLLTYSLVHVATRPDFTAYKYCDRNMFTTTLCRKVLGIQGVSWTIKTQEEYDIAVKDGWIPIFEGFTP